jgi:N-acetylmuramoyl-L-alanine amidase
METYVWSSEKGNQKIQAVAAKENKAIFADPNYRKNYGGGYSINSPEFIAKAKLKTKKYFTRSTTLANYIQDEGANAGRNDRNVRQRGIGIWVLQATAMPSVLVEMGYITNPEERDYLNSEEGQQQQADIVAKAIKKYKDELEAQQVPNSEPSSNDSVPSQDSTPLAAQYFDLRKLRQTKP